MTLGEQEWAVWRSTTATPCAALAEVTRPAQTIYLAELEAGSLRDDFSPWYGPDGPREDLAAERHSGGANYLFADGHARWLPYARTWSPADLCVPDGGEGRGR